MIQAEEKYTRLAARLLTEELSDIPSTQSEACGDTRRDAVVAAMALAIAEQARRRRIARGAVVVLALAGGACAMIVAHWAADWLAVRSTNIVRS